MNRTRSKLLRRRLFAPSAALSLWVLSAAPARAQGPNLEAVQTEVQKRIAFSGADVAIYFHTLDGKSEWTLHPDVPFHAASTMKLPVMIELFHQAQETKLTLDDKLAVRNEFSSIVDGWPYKLNSADDSELELYQAEGQTRTLRELCELMITSSSNLATNLLIARLGVENIRATVHQLNADGMNIVRGVEDSKAFEKNLNNTTTARGLGILLQAVADGQAGDRESSRQMVEILERQKFNEGIPAGLPPGTPVAHKTGEITKIHHDAAIVYAQRPYILVVLVRGLAEKKDSAALMADISKQFFAATQVAPP